MSEPTLLGARRLRRILEDHGVHPSKARGQNFVVDPNTIEKVVSVAGVDPQDRVLEIGAGAGSLTLALARVAARVTAVEIDARLVAALRGVVAGLDNVDVIEADALRLDLAALGANRLVSNLPYNIAASVVLRVLEETPQISTQTVMTQKEVGERLAARPGSPAYGLPSALVAYWGRARVAARVSRNAFYPVPNVDSVVVVVERNPILPDVDRERLFAVIRAAFGQRRKTLRNSLADLAGSPDAAAAAIGAAGLAPMARPENAGLDELVAIANELAARSR